MPFFDGDEEKKSDGNDVIKNGGAGFKPALILSDPSPLVLPDDPKEAQKIFNSLPIKSQLDIVLQARGKEQLHYLFLSEHPEQLVQQLSGF